MKTIKIFRSEPTLTLQYHNQNNWIDGYFVIYTKDIADCDVLVVFAEGGWNNFLFKTNAKRRIVFLGEPSSIYRFNEQFLSQFTDVVTSQYDVKLPQSVKMHKVCQCNNYFIGFNLTSRRLDLGILQDTYNNLNKNKLISAIVSDKCYTEYHRKRQQFVLRLKKDIPELDIFGKANDNYIDFKDQALRHYKYSIAIENCIAENYWTEKIADCVYSLTDPIYCGCPNIDNYFEGITSIDINDYDGARQKIIDLISGPFDIDKMVERRHKLLQKWSFHPVIRDILNGVL